MANEFDGMTNDDLRREYESLAHAVQSGIAAEMEMNPSPTSPKHLRVGVSMAMSDQSGLAKLLIDKGIITEHEYFVAMVEAARREVKLHEDRLSGLYGRDIKLA